MRINQCLWLLASNQGGEFRVWLIRTIIGVLVALAVMGVYYYLTHRHHQPRSRRIWFSKVIYFAFLVTVGVLAITSFGSILWQEVMQHYALLGHLTAAGAFVFLLLPLACFYLPSSLRWSRTWWLESLSAWVMVLSSLTVAASMLVSMLPVADTSGLLQLTEVHRLAGLIAVSSATLHAFALVVQRLGMR